MIEKMRIQNRLLLLTACVAVLTGCSRVPARVLPPEIPDDAGVSAVSKYDSNGDGALDGTELDQIPSLKSALGRFDANHDGKIDADEIAARVQAWRDTRIGLIRGSVRVMLDGKPLEGAEVRIVPEEFLGTAIQVASGVTDHEGRTSLKVSNEPRQAGMQLGLYKVEVSKKLGDEESLPPKYNTQTTLGVEIAPGAFDDDWTIKLTRK